MQLLKNFSNKNPIPQFLAETKRFGSIDSHFFQIFFGALRLTADFLMIDFQPFLFFLRFSMQEMNGFGLKKRLASFKFRFRL